MLLKVSCQHNEEMLFSVDILRHDAQHVNISIVTIGLQLIAAKDFKTVSEFFKIYIVIVGIHCNLLHPLIDNLLKFNQYFLFGVDRFQTIIVIVGEYLIEYDKISLILIVISLIRYLLMWTFEFL